MIRGSDYPISVTLSQKNGFANGKTIRFARLPIHKALISAISKWGRGRMGVPSVSALVRGKIRLLIISLVSAWLGILCDWASTAYYTEKISYVYEMHPAYSPISAFILFSIVIPVAYISIPNEGRIWRLWFLFLSATPWLGFLNNMLHLYGLLVGLSIATIMILSVLLTEYASQVTRLFTRRSLEIVGEQLKKHALLSTMTTFIVSIGLAFGSGYWLGVLSVPSEYIEILDINEGLWCARTDVVKDDANCQWNISAILENKGRDNITVTMVLLEGYDIYENRLNRSPSVFGDNVTVSSLPLTIEGLTTDFSIDRPYGHTTLYSAVITVTVKYGTLDFISASTVEIMLHTESGLSYRIMVTLP